MEVQHWFLHVDLDAFFASVEQLDFPQYRGKPLIVGGLPEDKRSVVSTASYEARKYGVHSAMPVFQAVRLCPNGIFVRGRMKRYAELSFHIMNILKEYSPDVQQMSIDEAFVDLTGTEALFGPPEQTAYTIKQRIKDETGLTVSVGMAQTKYLAKIASDINKPNGFYKVEPGKETEFMLSLPIKDIFGVGKKSVERIKARGIETTRQLYELDLPVIKFMFGDNQGQFLYDALRGKVEDAFDGKAKSHSISSETTFPDDITDIYAAETALLELCQGIMFRLLKEESFSSTIMIKIRYEDFSTVSIQRTYDKNILIVDDLYAKAKELFEEKFIKGRGLRLLGIAFENVQTEEKAIQLELFDDGNEKKQAVEKAILGLEKKHPEIKIQKARLLDNKKPHNKSNPQKPDSFHIKSLILLLSSLFLFGNKSLKAEDKTVTVRDAAGIYSEYDETETNDKNLKSIFQWNMNNTTVDFQFSGYWKFMFEGAFNSTFGYGTPFALSTSLPVIKQEIDLSALINITDKWFFALDFVDGFTKNTYSFGYKNNDAYFQNFLFSNRGIVFPDIYASEKTGYIIGGGSNQAPGFYFHFGDFERNKWVSDFVFRYDLTKQQSGTWYGKNQVNDNKISPEKYVHGKMFVIPANIESIDGVYVEYSKGDILDSNGRKYKKLNYTEYALNYSQKLLIISENTATDGKSILVTFNSSSKLTELISELGTYSDSNSFLGKIQQYFGSKNNTAPVLSDYNYNFLCQIKETGKNALILQTPSVFSPFACMHKYDCGIIRTGEVSVISEKAETLSKDYDIEFNSYSYTAAENYLYNEKRLYADVINLESTSSDFMEPENRYPMADRNPEIYLSNTNNSDLLILLRTYNAVTYFDIGKKAAGGTVRAYINGDLDAGASYDEDSGFVTLSREIGNTDKIYITWQEEDSDLYSGAIVTAGGFKYSITDNWNTNFNIAARWPCSPLTKFADSLSVQNGFALIGAGTEYSYKDFSLSDQLVFAVDTENSTGVYLANTQNTTENETYYLGINSGFETKITPVINPRITSIELSQENNRSVKNVSGVLDSAISGYKIPVSFDFSSGENGETLWASKDIRLNSGSLLAASSELEIALQADTDISKLDVYLQLGIKAESTFNGENPETIPVWKLNNSEDYKVIENFNCSSTKWQTVKIKLEDSDRSKLSSVYDARLIIVYKDFDSSNPVKGTLYAGPYEPWIQGCFTESSDKLNVTTSPVVDSGSSSAKKLFKEKSYATSINWTNSQSPVSTDNLDIIACSYFDAADFSEYENISFDFKYSRIFSEAVSAQDTAGLTLLLDRNSESLSENGEIALKLEIASEVIKNLIESSDNWNKLNINLKDKTVSINSSELNKADYYLYINSLVKPVRQKLIINTNLYDTIITKGNFVAGNLYFENCKPGLTGKNIITSQYKKDGDIVKIKDFSLLKNGNIQVNSEQNLHMNTAAEKNNSALINAYGKGEITVAGIKLAADGLIKAANNNNISLFQNGGHSVATEKSLFNILSFEETYRFAQNDNSLEKLDKINISLKQLHIPAVLQFSTAGKENYFLQTQNINGSITSDFTILDQDFKFSAKSNIYQKLKGNSAVNKNYFGAWYEVSGLQFSLGEKTASNRKINFNTTLNSKFTVLNLNPVITYESEGQYSVVNDNIYENKNRFALNIPVTIGNHTFAYNQERIGGSNLEAVNSTDYSSDFTLYGKLEASQNWFYTAIPVYDLFSKKLSDNIFNSGNPNDYYSTSYSLNYRRKFLNNFSDFYIPQAAVLSISRDLRTTDTISDLYQLKTTLTCMSINVFGSKGSMALFDFFESDEYALSFTSAVKMPADRLQDTTVSLSTYGSMLLYLADKNVIRVGFDLSIDTSSNWMVRTTASWNRPSTFSLLVFIPELLFENISSKDLKISRKELLNITAGTTDYITKITAEYSHSCDINFWTNYWITTKLTGSFGFTEATIFRAGFEYSLGGKITF